MPTIRICTFVRWSDFTLLVTSALSRCFRLGMLLWSKRRQNTNVITEKLFKKADSTILNHSLKDLILVLNCNFCYLLQIYTHIKSLVKNAHTAKEIVYI